MNEHIETACDAINKIKSIHDLREIQTVFNNKWNTLLRTAAFGVMSGDEITVLAKDGSTLSGVVTSVGNTKVKATLNGRKWEIGKSLIRTINGNKC